MQYPGGYMDYAMWCSLLDITEFYDKFKVDPMERQLKLLSNELVS